MSASIASCKSYDWTLSDLTPLRINMNVHSCLLYIKQVESFMSGGESPDKLWASLALLTAEMELVTACGRCVFCSADAITELL
jgi:hypothetical protein